MIPKNIDDFKIGYTGCYQIECQYLYVTLVIERSLRIEQHSYFIQFCLLLTILCICCFNYFLFFFSAVKQRFYVIVYND